MIFISIYLGIICGYILKFLKMLERLSHKNKEEPSANFFQKLRQIIYALSNYTLSRMSCIVKKICWGVCQIFLLIKKFFLLVIKTILSGICHIKLFFIHIGFAVSQKLKQHRLGLQKWWTIQKIQLLSHDFIYVWAKVTKVYSESDNKISLLSYNSIKQYCHKHHEKYILLEPSQNRPVCLPEFFERSKERITFFPSPEIYLAHLHNVRISGGSSIILSSNECLYDPFISDTDKRLDIKFSNVIGNINGKVIVETEPENQTIPEGIFLMGFASYNYYHFCIEIMSRLRYVDAFEEYRSLPIIVDQIMLKVSQYREIIEKFNCFNHPVIEIKPSETFKVEKLIYPSYNTWMPINVKAREMIRPSDFLIAKSGLDNIRSYIDTAPAEQDKNIFISRKNVATTRLGNEAKIVSLFQKYGFEIVYTEDLSYKEQITLFHSAKCVVATSGAALTNIVYCQPGTEIICIIPMEYEFYMYSTMAHILNLKSIFLDAYVIQKTAYTASDIFEVDEEYCERFLKQYTACTSTM